MRGSDTFHCFRRVTVRSVKVQEEGKRVCLKVGGGGGGLRGERRKYEGDPGVEGERGGGGDHTITIRYENRSL